MCAWARAYINIVRSGGGTFAFALRYIPIHIFAINYLVFTINQQSTNTPSELLRVDLSVLKDNTHTRPSVFTLRLVSSEFYRLLCRFFLPYFRFRLRIRITF